jgi:Protein of unknown function (DUF2680).
LPHFDSRFKPINIHEIIFNVKCKGGIKLNTISNNQSLSSLYYQEKNQLYRTNQKSQNGDLAQTGSQKSNGMEETLNGLVSDGTITEDQEDAIQSAFESAFQSTAYTRFKIQSSSEETEKVDPLNNLVTAGTITQDQADKIKDALDQEMKTHGQKQQQGVEEKNNPMSDILDSLVTNGTITEDQETAIKSAFEDSMKSGKMQPPPPPPQSQQSGDSSITDILDSLVSDDTDTEDQQSSISSIFQSAIKAYMAQVDSAENLYSTNATNVSL